MSHANKRGVFVSHVENLDARESGARDVGEYPALSRTATALNREDRADDAVAVMEQVYRMKAAAGAAGPPCFRIPRYYLKANRPDEAWEYLMQMQSGQAVGNSLDANTLPAHIAQFYSMQARVVKRDRTRSTDAATYEAASEIAMILSELWIAQDGVPNRAVKNRADAIRQITMIASRETSDAGRAEVWAEQFLGSSGKLTWSQAARVAAQAYMALRERASTSDRGA